MSNKKNDLMPAALYARVSSDRQDVDLSVAAQLRALRDYAKKNGYLAVREYVDEAESGRIADRPQFRKMLDEASKPEAPFQEILVWKFSRFTRKREHAVAFKSMLRRKGVRVVSITEHADDTPTGKLMEAIIESVDEFYSENLAQEVTRGMREAASRGFWMTASAPYGYERVYVQDGAKKRPRLELNPPHDAVVRRIFDLTLQGKTSLDILRTFNGEGIPSPNGKQWRKTTVHKLLTNEAYTGTLVWGQKARDGQEPVRVEDAFPAIVSQQEFQRVRKLLEARAPKVTHPRRAASPYLLSGLAKCESCGKALTAAEAKSGRYTYYVCQSILMQGSGTCDTPRLNAKSFEDIIISNIRDNILTESNVRDLVKLVDEEMDGVAREQRQNLETIEAELEEVKRKLDRIWHFVESTDLDMADASERILEHRHRREQLEAAAEEARAVPSQRRELLDGADVIAAFASEMSEFLKTSELTETKAFVRSFVKEVLVRPGGATIVYTIPTPEDSPIGGADAAEIALNGGVRSFGHSGGHSAIRRVRDPRGAATSPGAPRRQRRTRVERRSHPAHRTARVYHDRRGHRVRRLKEPHVSTPTRRTVAPEGPPTRPLAILDTSTSRQLACLKAHRTFRSQDDDARMRIDWVTIITPQESARFIRSEIHRKINAKTSDTQPSSRLATPNGQRDITWFRRHLQNRAFIHEHDGNALPKRLRRRMTHAHHPHLTIQQVVDLLRGCRPYRPGWMDAPDDIRARAVRSVALRHALRCQQTGRRQRAEAHLDYVNTCRICGAHYSDDPRPEHCANCRERLITDGRMVRWLAAVGPDGQPLGKHTKPRDHRDCPDWPEALATLARGADFYQ